MTEKSETLKAWAAGAFDGEGTALISEIVKGTNYALLVCITNNDKAMIDVFWDNWADKAEKEPYAAVSWKKTRRVFLNAGRAEQVIFDYPDAEELLEDILPYLVTKRVNALVALSALKSIKQRAIGLSGKDQPVNGTIADILRLLFIGYRHLWSRRGTPPR